MTAALVLLSSPVQAQIVSFDFTPPTVAKGTPGFTTPQAPVSSNPDLTVTDLGFGTGVFGDNNGGFWQNGLSSAYTSGASNDLATAITNGDYHTFSITVDPGYTLDLSGFSTSTWTGGDDGTDYLLTSATGFASADSLGSGANVAGYSLGASGTFPTLTPWTANLSGVSALQNLTSASGPIEFRIYEADSDNYGDQGEYTVALSGTVTSTTPEPSTWALVLCGVGLLLVVGFRRRA
jgi:hypothetical protein